MFPYPMNLTELDDFEPTKLEQLVAGNPSFQLLRTRGWPFKWGELVTGLNFSSSSADERVKHFYLPDAIRYATGLTEEGPLTPNAAGKLFGELSGHICSVLVLAAKVSRDVTDPNDRQLTIDLNLWLNRESGHYSQWGFRWERHHAQLLQSESQQKWAVRAAELQQGEAEVVAILRHCLPVLEMTELNTLFERQWSGDAFGGVELNHPKVQLEQHLPFLRCLKCDDGSAQHQSFNSWGKALCEVQNAIALVDMGSVADILRPIPRRFQKLVNVARFRIPRNTFRIPDKPVVDCVFPQMLVLSLEQLNASQQQLVLSITARWLESKKNQESDLRRRSGGQWRLPTYWLAEPLDSKHTNCLLLAGSNVGEGDWFDSVVGSSLQERLKYLPISVSVIESRSMWN